jgi:hypothetical protein
MVSAVLSDLGRERDCATVGVDPRTPQSTYFTPSLASKYEELDDGTKWISANFRRSRDSNQFVLVQNPRPCLLLGLFQPLTWRVRNVARMHHEKNVLMSFKACARSLGFFISSMTVATSLCEISASGFSDTK